VKTEEEKTTSEDAWGKQQELRSIFKDSFCTAIPSTPFGNQIQLAGHGATTFSK
jgi:hypothetical protein